MILTWEWVLILILAYLGQQALKVRPRLEERLGMLGVAAVLYVALKIIPFKILMAHELEPEICHSVAGLITFCPIAALLIWLRNGTLKAAADHQAWTNSWKAGGRLNYQEFMAGRKHDAAQE